MYAWSLKFLQLIKPIFSGLLDHGETSILNILFQEAYWILNLLLLDKTWFIELEMFNVYLLFISLVTLVAQILHKVGVFLVYK